MTKTNPETCHACGQVLPGEVEEHEDDGELNYDRLKAMSRDEHVERKDEVDRFLAEQRR